MVDVVAAAGDQEVAVEGLREEAVEVVVVEGEEAAVVDVSITFLASSPFGFIPQLPCRHHLMQY